MNYAIHLALLLFVAQSSDVPEQQESGVSRLRWGEGPGPIEVVQGPVVLRADLFNQWGGHTFPYLLEGKERLYWSGLDAYEGPALFGSVPKLGQDGEALVTRIPLAGDYSRVNPPQIVRTPDEHMHLFLSTRSADEEETGEIHYWRTVRPGDVSALVNRSALFPKTSYSSFTIRQNVGVSRDGERIVFCNLTDFVEGRHLINMPLVWIGERDGADFRFREPVLYGEQTAFFYPQVAATDEGPVLLGAVHREPNRNAELVHLDWEGSVLSWHAFPGIEGESWAFDMQPLRADDWSELAIARIQLPAEGSERGIEFWTYDTKTRVLERRARFPNDVETERSFASAGKLWLQPDAPPLFLNEPGSKQVVAWSGAFLEESGAVTLNPLPRTTVETLNYPQIRSLFFPSILQGSIVDTSGLRPMAVDVSLPNVDRERDGDRCAFLLWWLRR